MAIHRIRACADPRNEGSAAFERQLSEDIRLRNPQLRARVFNICGYRALLCPTVSQPHLRQYAVHVVADYDEQQAPPVHG